MAAHRKWDTVPCLCGSYYHTLTLMLSLNLLLVACAMIEFETIMNPPLALAA